MKNERCITIYKYRALSGRFGHEAIENAIVKSQLFWQSPLDFNDPFDCVPILYFGENDAERREFSKRAAAHRYREHPRSVRRRESRKIASVPQAQMEQNLCAAWNDWMKSSAVTCFSEVPDHPLMWGHYADSHRGVCLVFDEVANDKTEWFAFPVDYQEARPRVNLTRFNDPAVMMQALFLKSEHWGYEHEQRMVDWRGKPGYRVFPKDRLKSLILGARISEEDRKFVSKLLEKRRDLRLFQAEIDADEFKLNIVPA